MAPRFRPSGWVGRDARLVGTRPRVRGCPRQCWHFCLLPALSRRSGDVGSLPPPRSSEIEATHPHVNCRTGACRWVRPTDSTGGDARSGRGLYFYPDPYTLFRVFGGRGHAPSPRQPARPRRARLPVRAPDASLRDGRHHAYPGAGREYPPELRLAVRRRRDAAQAGSGRGAGGGPGGSPPRAHRLPHHRRRPDRARGLDGAAAGAGGEGIPAVRGRALAHGRAAAGAGRRAARGPGRRAAGPAVGAGRDRRGRDAQRRAARLPRGDRLRARAGRRRLRVHRAARGLDRVGVIGRRVLLEGRARRKAGAMNAIVDVEGIARSFGDTQALCGVDLSVPEGGVVALLGPNGAGKTTLVRILSTLLAPDAGSARVAGFDVVKQPTAVRRCIGLAGQYAAVDETLTGRENLEMVGRLSRLSKALAAERAAEVLERVSLSDAADRQLKTYSGSMRRRIDLGAGLVARPRVLLLD